MISKTFLPIHNPKYELWTPVKQKETFEKENLDKENIEPNSSPFHSMDTPRNSQLILPLGSAQCMPLTEGPTEQKRKINIVLTEKNGHIADQTQPTKSPENVERVRFISQDRADDPTNPAPSRKEQNLLDYVRSQIIGRNLLMEGPFGKKVKLYTDYTASGQDLKFIVEEISRISELYANTHTETSYTGSYTHHLLHQAEAMILKECKASHEEYFIIGGGSGSTFAIEMAQKILGTYIPPKTKQFLRSLGNDEEDMSFENIKSKLRDKGKLPLVLISPYEHHSNEITWRKQLCDVMEVSLAMNGLMDVDDLEFILKKFQNTRPIFGSFSAGSNVTGVKTNVEAVAIVCKKYGVKCFFDYAGVAPYVPIDLSKKTANGELLINGIYLSPHKFLGGPGSAGVLIMDRECYETRLHPTHGGGGTVNAVGFNYEDYVDDIEEREKSGTPGILQMIRAGLAFRLKGLLLDTIVKKEEEYSKIFFERMSKVNNLIIYGSKDAHSRINIIPFNIMMDGPEGQRAVHFNLIIRLLNDIFGIQGRGGCFCAGPYGHRLFGINKKVSNRISFFINRHQQDTGKEDYVMNFKPGWARLNLHYSLQDYELDYLMFAIEFLSHHAYKFLPLYTYDPLQGVWEHITYKWNIPQLDLGKILAEKREYAASEEERMSILQRQKKDAMAMLSCLPKSKEYDSVPELGTLSFYYFERGNLKHRNIVEEKCQFYKDHYLDWVRPDL